MSTCGTGVRQLGALRDTIDLILGHAIHGVTGVYDRYAGDREKKHRLSEWAEWLRKIVSFPSSAR